MVIRFTYCIPRCTGAPAAALQQRSVVTQDRLLHDDAVAKRTKSDCSTCCVPTVFA